MKPRTGAVFKGLAMGAAAGGLATGVETYLLVVVFGWVGTNPPPSPAAILEATVIGLPLIPVATVVAGLAFIIGLVVVGLPVWAALHALRLRSRWIAVIAGAVLAPASVWVSVPWSAGAPAFSWVLLGLVVPGSVAGWTLHRFAYSGSTSSLSQPQKMSSRPV